MIYNFIYVALINLCSPCEFVDIQWVSVNSKPDHPPGKTPGEFFKRVNSPPPGHKVSAGSRPLGQKNRAKTPLPGQLYSEIQQETQIMKQN